MPVIFCGVARQGGTVLATCFAPTLQVAERSEIEAKVRHCCPPTVRDGWSDKAGFDKMSGEIFFAGDQSTGAVYCIAVRDVAERIAKKLLGDLQESVQASEADVVNARPDALTFPLRKLLRRFLAKGDSDKLADIQRELDKVTATAQEAVQKIVENGESIEEMDRKAADMARQGAVFLDTAVTFRDEMWLRALKMKVLTILIPASILGYIVLSQLPETDSRRLLTFMSPRRE
jgi:hypothetical protein